MEMCDPCKGMETHKRGANSHPGIKAVSASVSFSAGIGPAKAR
jgi:hypothetical protein